LVTHFFYDVIIVHGDPIKENNLRIENKTSPVFDLKSPQTHHHTITTYLPARNTSWMLILKISNIELKDDPRLSSQALRKESGRSRHIR
jgi:hypothetical protein